MTETKTDELERERFEAWLQNNHKEIYRLAFNWGDDDLQELVHHAKASVLDMRTAWDAAWDSKSLCLPPDPDLGSDAEWYLGYMGGWKDCRNAIKNQLSRSGIKIEGEV